MATNPNHPRRIAVVLNALTGNELTAGKRDVARIFALLTNPELGNCSNEVSIPIFQCSSRADFMKLVIPVLKQISSNEQLIFYFSGHGEVRGSKYCLKLGQTDDDLMAFDALMSEFEVKAISRAIVILDACQSGAALGIKNSTELSSIISRYEIPKGMAILASSGATEVSRELDDGLWDFTNP